MVSVRVLSHFSLIQLSVTQWTVAHQAHLPMGILQARILEWVAMPSSKGSSQPRETELRLEMVEDEKLILNMSSGHVWM